MTGENTNVVQMVPKRFYQRVVLIIPLSELPMVRKLLVAWHYKLIGVRSSEGGLSSHDGRYAEVTIDVPHVDIRTALEP